MVRKGCEKKLLVQIKSRVHRNGTRFTSLVILKKKTKNNLPTIITIIERKYNSLRNECFAWSYNIPYSEM